MFDEIIHYIKELQAAEEGVISLHTPFFGGNEKKYLLDCIESTYVSSVGSYVNTFEQKIAEFTGAKHAIATVNGTAALHTALLLSGVQSGDEVITQAVSFVATSNAIAYCGAEPVFLDNDKASLGLNPLALEDFLNENTEQGKDGFCYNRRTGKRISVCVPMHVFGHPSAIEAIVSVCDDFNIQVVEDAAESLGSYYGERHTGTFGRLGILSFNGNKIITTGGGGMVLTDDDQIARRAKHLTTTAKVPHAWEYSHDMLGFNYRLPNINAALGCAQIEKIAELLAQKRELADQYRSYFESLEVGFVSEPSGCHSNYWLNAILFTNLEQRNLFLEYSNENGVMCRPIWNLLPDLPMYKKCQTDSLDSARWLWERVVNIPSSVRL